MFILKACSNSLPTKANLYKRRLLEDPICELCGEEAETLDHLLLHRAAMHLVWYNSLLRVYTKNLEGVSFKEFVWSSTEKRPPEYVSMLSKLAWEICSTRNATYFEKLPFEFQCINQKVMNRCSEGKEKNESTSTKFKHKARTPSWQNPKIGSLKMNSDIAVWPNERVGIGFLI